MIRIVTNIKIKSPNIQLRFTAKDAVRKYYCMKKDRKNSCETILYLLKAKQDQVPKLPVHVKLIRYSTRPFDYDNFVFACKYIRDTIADFLIPGKPRGQSDNSLDIYWHYHQLKKNKEDKETFVVEISN